MSSVGGRYVNFLVPKYRVTSLLASPCEPDLSYVSGNTSDCFFSHNTCGHLAGINTSGNLAGINTSGHLVGNTTGDHKPADE